MNLKILSLMLIAMCAGGLVPFQTIVNSRLGVILQHRLLAAVISFTGGFVALVIIMLIASKGMPKWPAGAITPWYLYSGGFIGAVFVFTLLSLGPKIGVANVMTAAILGQLVVAVVVDHFGRSFGMPFFPVSGIRLLGLGLMMAGVLLIQYRP